jgi:membrane protease YdiL (CAAX protease family)
MQTTALILWTLTPCLAIWIGMYEIKSAAWTFVIYHGVCLLPQIIKKRSHWTETFRKPTAKQLAILIFSSILFSAGAVLLYEIGGKKLLSDSTAIDLLKQQGFNKQLFWPLSFYAIVVNPLVEEIFWRGVVLNELEKPKALFKNFPVIWSSFAYALFHYLIFRLVMFPIWAELSTVLLALYGAMLATIYRKTGSILTTAIAHGLLTDMAAIVLILDLFRKHPGILY